jgi:hypothetical protein
LLPEVKIIEYPQLEKYNNILDIFDGSGRCVLFFTEDEDGSSYVGHWQCVFRNGNIINFFDSYGLFPDKVESYLNQKLRLKFNENKPLLMPLLKNASERGYKVLYNNVKLQEMKHNVDTCGDYVASRLMHKNLSNDQYISFLDELKKQFKVNTYDEAVGEYIAQFIGK